MTRPRTFFAALFLVLLGARLCHVDILWAEEDLPMAAAKQMAVRQDAVSRRLVRQAAPSACPVSRMGRAHGMAASPGRARSTAGGVRARIRVRARSLDPARRILGCGTAGIFSDFRFPVGGDPAGRRSHDARAAPGGGLAGLSRARLLERSGCGRRVSHQRESAVRAGCLRCLVFPRDWECWPRAFSPLTLLPRHGSP